MNVLYIIDRFSVVEPMGVMQLSAVTKPIGHKNFIASHQEGFIPEIIRKYGIDAVGMSIMSTEAKKFYNLSRSLRQEFPNLIQIAGGPHPTFYPKIIETWDLDAIVLGEGERVVIPLLERLFVGQDISDLLGVHTKNFKNPQPCLIEDLNSVPFVDRELVENIAPFRDVSMKTIFATRGCPFNCAYCFNAAYKKLYDGKGPIIRRRSVENVISELTEVKARYNPSFIRFGDDTLIVRHEEWLEQFCKEYRKHIAIPFYCLVHPQIANEPIVKLLKGAGCHSVMMGIESGIEEVRRKLLNRWISNEKVRESFDLFRKHGIKVFGNTILAIPETTIEDDIKSLEFTLDCRPYYSGFSIFTPFPGTPLGDYARQMGYVKDFEEESSLPISIQAGSVLNTVTDKEREIHHNILALAPVANLFPVLRKIITRQLIYWKPNFIFDAVGFLVRNYCNMKVWPFKKSSSSFFRIFLQVLKIDKSNYYTKSDKN